MRGKDKMSNEIKRMNYFDGLLLKEEDLRLDQDYHKKLHRLHNRFFHDWGIVDGLTVEEVPNFPKIIVKNGFAINRVQDETTHEQLSQEIWITDNHPDNPVDLSQCDVGKNIYITVSYEEEIADIDSNKGGDREIHIWERGRIKYYTKKPAEVSKDIIVACLKLKLDEYNNKIIDKDSIKYDYIVEDGVKIQVCTYAVTQGTNREFQKISIGKKDKLNLPYISGLTDDSIGSVDGLEVHSPCTKFTGTVLGVGLKTSGDVEVNGELTVKTNDKQVFNIDDKGDVYIEKNALITGELSSKGGLDVTGNTTTLDTVNVVMTGNMLSINNYPPDKAKEAEKMSSGIEVYRGSTNPSAKLIWDEDTKVWKAGTDKKDGQGGLYPIAYGEAWNKLTDNKSIADDYHRHSAVYSSEGAPILKVVEDDTGTVSLVASGSIVANFGIEAPSDGTTARLEWNEDEKHWQIGTDKQMYKIAYGSEWNLLSGNENADKLHKHSEFYNNSGDIKSMHTTSDGDVIADNNLEVQKNVTIKGNLSVLGDTTEYKTVSKVVNENVVLVNKPEVSGDSNGKMLNTEGGLEVYRGEGNENARLIWDEGSDSWKLGTGKALSEIPCGDDWEYLTHGGLADNLHNHGKLYKEDGTAVVSVDQNGNLSVEGSLNLKGDLNLSGTQTTINKKNVDVEDSIIIVNKYTGGKVPLEVESGMEVYRGGVTPNARLIWSELDEKWRIGVGQEMHDLLYGNDGDKSHYHSKLCDKAGKVAIDTDEKGTVIVNGDLKVSGDTAYVYKETIQVKDNVILLNNYEGETSPAIYSGIDIYRGSKQPKARLVWDEEEHKWKLGIGDYLQEIAYGSNWNVLTENKNSDKLHLHGQLYNENGDILALSTRATGSVDVAHDLTVGQDLTVLGALNVKGPLTRIDSKTIEILSNSITISRFDSGDVPKIKSGLTVFRGSSGSTQNAVVAWDEVNSCWKIGMLSTANMADNSQDNGTLKLLKVKADGSIEASAAIFNGSLTAKSATIYGTMTVNEGIDINRGNEGTAGIKWLETNKQWRIGTNKADGIIVTENGYVGIGNLDPREKLDVSGNASISGNLMVNGNSVVKGNISAVGAEIQSSIKITGNAAQERGLEVSRGNDSYGNQLQPAKITWDESSKCWIFGMGNRQINFDGNVAVHKHSELYTQTGNGISVSTDANGNVGIGTTSPKAMLEVDGTARVNQKLTANAIDVVADIFAAGKVIANSFEAPKGNNKASPKLCWSGKAWQAGLDGSLTDISLYGHKHPELTKLTDSIQTNLIALNDIINVSEGKIAVGKLNTELNLYGNTTINGYFTTLGNIDALYGRLKTKSVEITETLSAVDVNASGKLTVGGIIDIAGTDATPKAQIVWDDKDKKFKAGATGSLKNICYEEDVSSITTIVKEDAGKISVGRLETDLNLYGNTTINGFFTTLGNIDALNGRIKAKSVEIIETLSAVDVSASGKLTLSGIINIAGTDSTPKAQLIWNDKDTCFKAGVTGDLKKLINETDLKAVTDTVQVDSVTKNVGIGKAPGKEVQLDVAGNANINGNATITGTMTVNNEIYIKIDNKKTLKVKFTHNDTNNKWELDAQEVTV
jgi:hypothetical protein